MRDLVTTLFDGAGVLLVVAGVTAGLWPLVGPVALAVGGLLLMAAARLSEWSAAPAALGWLSRLRRAKRAEVPR